MKPYELQRIKAKLGVRTGELGRLLGVGRWAAWSYLSGFRNIPDEAARIARALVNSGGAHGQ